MSPPPASTPLQHVHRQVLLAARQALGGGPLEHQLARDAGEAAGRERRREQLVPDTTATFDPVPSHSSPRVLANSASLPATRPPVSRATTFSA